MLTPIQLNTKILDLDQTPIQIYVKFIIKDGLHQIDLYRKDELNMHIRV